MSESNFQKRISEGNRPDSDEVTIDNMKSDKSKFKQRVFEIFLFIIIAGFLVTTGLSTELVSHKLFSRSYDDIEEPAILNRDRLYGVEVIDNSTFWIVGNFGKILKTVDGGKNFLRQESPVYLDLQDIDAWNKDQAVIVGDEGVILITKDGGNNWHQVPDVPKSEFVNKLFRVLTLEKGRAFAVGAMGMILLTENYGKNWERISEKQDLAWNDITFVDVNTGWVAGEFGSIMKTSDGGRTWESKNSGIQNSIMAIAAKDENNIVGGSFEGVLLKSTDGGDTWNLIQADTTEHFLDILSLDDDSWVGIGTGGMITYYHSGTTPRSWKSQKLSENDYFWHTEIEKIGNDFIIVGKTTGRLSNGEWLIF